ncbi:MAG: hypothetical protein A2Y81_03695 [Nitrospirae bacterium RBG_13_43_8]|nr:MAG: hypothetical protein A2Y81_03695 [Nitrospirae bacterium RBG_13_43_8]
MVLDIDTRYTATIFPERLEWASDIVQIEKVQVWQVIVIHVTERRYLKIKKLLDKNEKICDNFQ